MVKLVDEMLKNILLLQISLNLPSVVEAIDVGMKMLAVPLLGRFFAIIVSKFLQPSIDRLKFTKGQLIDFEGKKRVVITLDYIQHTFRLSVEKHLIQKV